MMLTLVTSIIYQILISQDTHTSYKPRCNRKVCKFIFSNRVVDVWKRLDQNIIDSGTINTFWHNEHF